MIAYQPIWELEAWSPPGQLLDQEFGKLVLAPQMWRDGISPDVFMGLSAIPDKTDSENLKADLLDGAVSMSEFTEFCAQHNVSCSVDDQLSASRFLEFTNGRALAWVHIPDDERAVQTAMEVRHSLEKKGLRLLNPDTMKPVTAENPFGLDDA